MSAEQPSLSEFESTAALLSVLASSTKLAILCELAGGAATVGALCGALDLSQSLVSHHLATLRGHGLVRVGAAQAVARVSARPAGPGPG
jgi:DNA-binding transcriptional ArsR family regulator